MRWVLLDVVLVLLALGLLALLALGLWRRVRALSATVARAGEAVGRATDVLAAAQADGPLAASRGSAATAPGRQA